MASQDEILKLIAGEESSIHRNKIAEKLGESSYRPIQTQLDRLTKAGYLNATSDHEYSATDAGKNKLFEKSEVTEEISEEKLGTTEYQRFIHLGKKIGIAPPELLQVTADHIWNGGSYSDLDWVAKALQEMGIRQELRNRWWHSWRTSLNQPIPGQLPEGIAEKIEEGKEGKSGSKKGDKPPRSYILDADNNPVYVGGGLGDLDYEDAKELALAKAAGRARGVAGASQTPGSMADELVKLFGAFQQFMGDRSQGKSYMVHHGESGLEVEEVDPGRPMILNYPSGDSNKQKPTYLVNQDGEVQEVQPGQPIVIKQPAPPVATGGMQYLIDRTTGQITQVQPGQPIVIQTQPQQQSPYTPIQMKDKDGNPMVLDLSTFIRLEEHRDKQRHDEESHEVKMEIAKGFKEMLGKASIALGHVTEEK